MKRLTLIFISLLLFPLISRGQIQTVLPVSTAKNGSLTAVAYDWEVIGVNPANLGWSVNHTLSFTVLDAGVSGQSQGMNFPALMNVLGSKSLLSTSNSSQKIFGTSYGMNTEDDINWFAVSFRIPKVPGAFAVNLRDRIDGNGFLGPNTPKALINTDNQVNNDQTILSYLDGTTLQYNHYREINLDYGVPLFNAGGVENTHFDVDKCFSFNKAEGGVNANLPSFYGGVGVKYLMGIANINSSVTNGGINALYAINSNYPNMPDGFFNTPGHGFAFDMGLSAIYKRWKFGWSVTDMGSIKWKNSYTTTADTNVYNIRHGSDLVNELGTGTLGGSQPAPNYTTALPAKMRMGASYKLTPAILLSSDVVIPLNNNTISPNVPYFAVGVEVKIINQFTISSGFATAVNHGWGIPLGVAFSANKHIEFYIGTNDVSAFMGKPNNAEVSAAIGLFRYNL